MPSPSPTGAPTVPTVPSVRRRRAARRRALSTVTGVLGELLITAGVLVALFLVWQLWWTSVVARHEAEAVLAEVRAAMPPAVDAPAVLRTDDPPVPDPVDHGDSMGILIVPSWQGLTDNAMPIVEGTSTDLLDRALAGHYPQTQQIGQVGNAVLAGHRRTHGDNFRHLDDLAPGDPVVIETATTWYVYQITSHEIVLPTQTDVLLPVPHQPGATPTQRLLTLTTCHSLTLGEYGNDHRWITYATFTGWMDRAAGTPDVILAMQDAVG